MSEIYMIDGSLTGSPKPTDEPDHRTLGDSMSDQEKKRKRKRHSLQEHSSTGPSVLSQKEKGKQRAATMGAIRASPEQEEEEGSRKGKGRSSGLAGFTSCEACRRGKRRCEPSPLVPPDHPDAAKLPCARCRRFAIECVRVKAVRRKGPAPVAVSDAAHGYSHDDSTRRHSAVSDVGYDSERMITSSFNSPGPSPQTATLEGIDQVMSGPVIDNVLSLFFDYVYPLTPCLHRPTFIANLTARRDRTDPVFLALTLTVIASTLVQVPRALMNMHKDDVEALARKCLRVAREKMGFIWDEPASITSTMVVIAYLEGIVHLFLGNNTAHVVTTAQANQLALALRLNEETTYQGLDPIEKEMRRRIYWLLFQADKSTACLRARAMSLRLEDAYDLLLPSEVDDEMITSEGILPQPANSTPLLAGFNVVTNLFRVLNDVIIIQRRKSTRTMDEILADLQRVSELREKVMQTSLSVPDPLKLRNAYDSRSASPAFDWESRLRERFVDFFRTAGDSSHALNSFLVMQGNILVTQHVVRLVLLQTRQSLLAQLAIYTPMAYAETEEKAEDIAGDLLDGLNSLPVECVATNGPSLVQKVRFVGIQLMESSTGSTTTRSQRLLMQFLSVLSVIEGMYSFGKDISAE